jgi:hypothetical protein
MTGKTEVSFAYTSIQSEWTLCVNIGDAPAWFRGDNWMLPRHAADAIERLIGLCDDTAQERDEARRLYCKAVEEMERGLSNDSRRDVAKARGWDCYDNYTEEEVTDDGSEEF